MMSTRRRIWLATAAVSLLAATTASPAIADLRQFNLESTSLSGNYLAGRYAGKLRDLDIAAQFFNRALQEDPNNPVLIERAFILDLSAGNMPRAEELARQVMSFNRQHRMSRVVLGFREMRAKRYEKAREHFKNAAFTPVGELSSGLLTAWSYAAERNLAKAINALDILDKNEAFTNFKLFHAALIADFLDSPSRAENFYKKADEKAGTSLRVVQAYGSYLARTNRKDEALKVYDRFLAGSSSNALVKAAKAKLEKDAKIEKLIRSANDGMAEAMFSVASALSSGQSIDVSLIYTQLALSLKRDFDVARVLQAEVYEETRRYDKAIEAYEKVDKKSVLRTNADIQIAGNMDRLKRSDDALKRLDELIARQPDNYSAIVTQGNILRAKEKWLPAAESYAKAIALVEPLKPRLWTLLYFRGISYERAKDWPKAEADFRRALKLKPDESSVLNYLGYSLIEKRLHLDEALKMVRKAVDLKPNDGYIVDSLGWAYYHLRDYEEAVKHLERAVSLKPQDPTINDHLGDAYWRVGRKLEARFQWQHSIDSKPETKEDLAKIKIKLKDGLAPDADVKVAAKQPDKTPDATERSIKEKDKPEPPKTQVAAKPPEVKPEVVHIIKAGDTLWDIARKYYKDALRYIDLYEANRAEIPNPNRISIGQKIKIPDVN